MKIFVAGGTGVIGRRVVPLLVEAGHDVSVLCRSEAKAEQIRGAGAVPVATSLFDLASLTDAVAGHEAVINLSTHIPPLSKSARASAWQENDRIRSEGAPNLVDAALAGGARRLVQESLAFTYADHGAEWIDESEPLLDTPVTRSVRDAEAAVARFAASGGVGVVLRFGQFYAPEASHTKTMVAAARRGFALLPGAPEAYTTTIAADDAASAVVAALDAAGGVYNIVDSDPLTRAEWAAAMAAAVGRTRLRPLPRLITKSAAKRGPTLVSSQRVSNQSFRSATPWQPRYESFRDGAIALTRADAGSSRVAS